jgi:hypothetical protein
MWAAAVTYSLVCLGIGLYAGWVWLRQRRLSRCIQELQVSAQRPRQELHSKAA